jgi:pimeloyl-ACP methyl ester carboxylesterase
MRHTLITLAIGFVASAASAQGAGGLQASAAVQSTPATCAALMKLQVPGVNLAMQSAQWIEAGPMAAGRAGGPPTGVMLPAYCRLNGAIDPRIGANGVSYAIGFALALPANWNGRFLQQGGGGLNGSVGNPIGTQATGNTPALARGFAVVSTDTGHTGKGAFDGSFQQDQQASLDFAYAAIGKVAEVAKRIIATHYQKPVDKSYFAGCSTGGREGMMLSQRYPRLFDGIVSGAPAMRTAYSGIGDQWVAVQLNQVAPKNAQGQPDTRNALTEAQKQGVINGFLAACDELDGLRDGMVFNTTSCKFDPRALVCKGGTSGDCLTQAQADALVRGFAGPKDSKGIQVYPGFLFDTGLTATQGIAGLLHGGSPPGGGSFSAMTMDVDAAAERAAANPAESLSTTSRWVNLNTFAHPTHQGKLLFYHGVSDPWFSALDTIDYYERLTKANGGPEQVRNWSRLFLSPGMGHCGGGTAALDTFDALTAVVDWVEKGVAPTSLTATGRAFPGRSRPLCAYPLHAHYKGSGSTDEAANFECRP